MFRFMMLNDVTTQILFCIFSAVHPNACLAVALRRRITRHTDRATSYWHGENSSNINLPPDYLVMVPARRITRLVEETSLPIRSNMSNQGDEKRKGEMM